jgi:hypothetical protein
VIIFRSRVAGGASGKAENLWFWLWLPLPTLSPHLKIGKLLSKILLALTLVT